MHTVTTARKKLLSFFSLPQTSTRCLTQHPHHHPSPTLPPPYPKIWTLSVLTWEQKLEKAPPKNGTLGFCQFWTQEQILEKHLLPPPPPPKYMDLGILWVLDSEKKLEKHLPSPENWIWDFDSFGPPSKKPPQKTTKPWKRQQEHLKQCNLAVDLTAEKILKIEKLKDTEYDDLQPFSDCVVS